MMIEARGLEAGSFADLGHKGRKMFPVIGLLQTESELKGDRRKNPPKPDRCKMAEDTLLDEANRSRAINAGSTATARSHVNLLTKNLQVGHESCVAQSTILLFKKRKPRYIRARSGSSILNANAFLKI